MNKLHRLTLFIVCILLLCACTELDLDVAFFTLTPTGEVVSPSPSPSATLTQTAEFTPTITPIPTPTPICVIDDHCLIPVVDVTPIGGGVREYIKYIDGKIRCVAKEDGVELNCLLRTSPSLDASYKTRGHGVEVDVIALYHCEFYARCDRDVEEWYLTLHGDWAAGLDDVWVFVK